MQKNKDRTCSQGWGNPPIFQGAGLLHSGIVSTFATPNQAQVERHNPLTLQRM